MIKERPHLIIVSLSIIWICSSNPCWLCIKELTIPLKDLRWNLFYFLKIFVIENISYVLPFPLLTPSSLLQPSTPAFTALLSRPKELTFIIFNSNYKSNCQLFVLNIVNIWWVKITFLNIFYVILNNILVNKGTYSPLS